MAVPALGALLAVAAVGPGQYWLEPGDHLVFRQVLEREVASAGWRAAMRFAWTSHVLVLNVSEGRVLVGVQRNRDRGELVRYVEGGRDRTEAERPGFAAELERGGRAFAEANRFSDRGHRLLPLSVVREGTSEVLPSIHELPPLPSEGSAGGWLEPGLLGLTLSPRHEGDCLRIAGEEGRLRIAYVVCDGALQSLQLQAGYDTPVNRSVKEHLEIERIERRQGEHAAAWLEDAATREAVLQAWMIADARPGSLPSWRSGDELFDRRLAVATRRFEAPEPSADPHDAALLPVARAAFGAGALPGWNCAVPDRAERGVRLRRASAQVPGTTLRAMRTAGFTGRHYLLHVPESYRGDRPCPLLVLLAGGAGRAVPMAQSLRDLLGELEYLVLMPDARGEMWWTEGPTRAFMAVLDEVMAELNVDPRRVLLSGFSNGATGALLYATLQPDRFAAVASLMGPG